MVNFVAATHPKGQKRCRRGDACQITSFDVKTLVCGRSFCSYLGRAYEVLLEISGSERTRKKDEGTNPSSFLNHKIFTPLRLRLPPAQPPPIRKYSGGSG